MIRRLLLLLVFPSFVGATPLPDLAVRRDGFARAGDRLSVVVENRGDADAPATELELWDRPPLLGPTGTSTPYPPRPNRRGVWVHQEPAGPETIALDLYLGRDSNLGAYLGELRSRDLEFELPDDRPGVELGPDARAVLWDPAAMGDGQVVSVLVPARPGAPPRVDLVLQPDDETTVPTIHSHEADRNAWFARLLLDALDRDPARRFRVAVPPLTPGASILLEADFAGGVLGETIAIVDPDGQVLEAREGNNISSIRDDSADRTLAALHVHSSFSERAGSVDWQVARAARSGYDLIWWTEHDWRISCLEHVTEIGFEPADEGILRFPLPLDASAEARLDHEVANVGESSLLLRVGAGEAGRAAARLEPPRRRLTYSLAARVELALDVLVTDFDADDVLRITIALSHHEEGMRELLYELRDPGVVVSPPPAGPGRPTAVLPRPIPGGGWTRVVLPISRDAERIWANGLDNSVTGVEIRLISDGSGAEAHLDDLRVEHAECGDVLRRVQERWMEDYPNVAHAFGEEISLFKPHLNQYGGSRGVVDYEELWQEVYVDRVVERVHRSQGIVAWCHPFGVRSSPVTKRRYGAAYRDSLLATDFGGTELLEVGFRNKGLADLDEYLEFWDQAGLRGNALTGIGVNDSHEVQWGPWENNFATWITGPADDPDVLLRALRDGRAVFGDPLAFRGRFSIVSAGAISGDLVSGASPRPVTVSVEGAPPDSRVRLVADGEMREEWTPVGGRGAWTVELPGGSARIVRAELRGPGDRPLAFTNPIRFRRPD